MVVSCCRKTSILISQRDTVCYELQSILSNASAVIFGKENIYKKAGVGGKIKRRKQNPELHIVIIYFDCRSAIGYGKLMTWITHKNIMTVYWFLRI